ncbi:hypothetical protein BJF96_g4571 [Verticillium dahliae]|uniref:Mitochondrial division protein 1 n=1 Tax=Verticillium dahliae TaxID=27337 RepID=A0AA44WJI4_VERDA|nr:hypothetical protein BJF96_g4571 [Verticillium dahliae]PNH56253.1 hypothetical protein VD0003_g1417 [Verticillium dahliae]
MPTPATDYDQQLTGSPPPPPTPAASPGPSHGQLDWSDAADDEDFFLAKVRQHFKAASGPQRTRILGDLLNLCTSQQLSFVHQFVSPLLKKDPFTSLPDELCLRVLSFIDDPKVLARASQVSNRWRDLLSDDLTWKNLCDKHNYSTEEEDSPTQQSPTHAARQHHESHAGPSRRESMAASSTPHDLQTSSPGNRRPRIRTYRSHFKQKHQVEMAWRNGGTHITRNITQEGGVVTSLHLTSKYIIVALDNAKIHVFDAQGNALRTLQGHVMGVWAMVPWDDILVSGGCDRDVRVWDLTTGQIYAIAFDGKRVVTGSLDTNVRIWDPRTAECLAILQGHTSLVGQLQMRGDTLVTGGSDGSVRVWSLQRMCPIHRLAAHDNSVTSLQFDEARVVSGGSDGRVKIWDVKTGHLIRELIAQGEAVWRVAFEDEKCVALALRHGRTIMEVWSFSPPAEEASSYDRPLSLQQRAASEASRKSSNALQLDLRSTQSQASIVGPPRDTPGGSDIDMGDAGPSTAPAQSGNLTFFHDD